MTLDSFIEELERMPIYTTGDRMSDWFAGHSDRILAMAKALKAADAYIASMSEMDENGLPLSPETHHYVRETFNRLRAEVEL